MPLVGTLSLRDNQKGQPQGLPLQPIALNCSVLNNKLESCFATKLVFAKPVDALHLIPFVKRQRISGPLQSPEPDGLKNPAPAGQTQGKMNRISANRPEPFNCKNTFESRILEFPAKGSQIFYLRQGL